MNIYVGNLPWTISEEELRQEFEAFGAVSSTTIIKDKATNKSRGFGFVVMDSDKEAAAAIHALNGKDMNGRPLTVNEARPREEGGGDRRPSRF